MPAVQIELGARNQIQNIYQISGGGMNQLAGFPSKKPPNIKEAVRKYVPINPSL